MSKQDEYLDSAAQTVELATRTSSSGDKSHLLDLAEKWLDLADRSRHQAMQAIARGLRARNKAPQELPPELVALLDRLKEQQQ